MLLVSAIRAITVASNTMRIRTANPPMYGRPAECGPLAQRAAGCWGCDRKLQRARLPRGRFAMAFKLISQHTPLARGEHTLKKRITRARRQQHENLPPRTQPQGHHQHRHHPSHWTLTSNKPA